MIVKKGFFLICFLLIASTACTVNKSSDEKFSVSLRVPENIKVGESFDLEAILKNNLEQDYDIWHAGDLFGIAVSKEDEEFPDMIFNGSLVRSKLPSKEMISEKHRFVLDEPGQYKAIAKAVFEVGKDNQNEGKKYIIDSMIVKFEVK